MITRIVKLTISDNKIEEFRNTFRKNHNAISSYPGCLEVRLVFDVQNPNIHFTISQWESEEAIENYRKSDLFSGVWSTVKPWFVLKAEAWSTLSF